MEPRRVIHSKPTRILAAVLLLVAAGTAAAGAASESPGGGDVQGIATIATGSDMNVDGFLSVSPDDFGQWASVTFGGGGDIFNPAGAFAPLEATFTSALFLFVPSRTQRIVLTDNPSYVALGDDGSLVLTLTSPLASSDSSGDGVDDTLVSSFNVTGAGGTDLDFDLTQSVAAEGPGVAKMDQEYVITNNGTEAVDLVLARVYDGDLFWGGDPGNEFSNDQVGTDWNVLGGDLFVFEQEPGDPDATSITISSPSAISYFGGKHGVLPGLGAPPYDFGTDTEVFDNFGVPTSWVNNIAGVGYDTDGVSGPTPPGSTTPEDGFTGLGFAATVGPGESTTIAIRHTYGQAFPTPPPPPEPEVPVIEVPTLGLAGLVALVAAMAAAGGLLVRRRRLP